MQSIGSRVKWAREQRGLTQAALAKAACMLTRSIADLEAGTRDGPRDLSGLAGALAVRAAWLESGQGEWKAMPPGSDAPGHAAGPAPGPARALPATSVGAAIVELGAQLSALGPLARAGIAPLLARLAESPELATQVAQLADAMAQVQADTGAPDARTP